MLRSGPFFEQLRMHISEGKSKGLLSQFTSCCTLLYFTEWILSISTIPFCFWSLEIASSLKIGILTLTV